MSANNLANSFHSSAIRLFLLLLLVTCYLLLVSFPTYAANDNPTTQDTAGQSGQPNTSDQQNSDESALKPINAGNYGPDKHLLYTLMNLGGYAAGCLGEGSSLFGGECLDMVGGTGATAMGATPYLVNSNIRSGGALGALGGAMVAMSVTPPTSPVQYLASIGENFGIKPAYAQVTGSGNSVIEPILKLWQLTRNIAYFGFILVFMAIGFMIMFRQKLNPQTVISAQNALPGVVVALILVTFSYFIAALIIDFGFVTTQLTGRILSANGLANQTVINKTLAEKNIFGVFGSFIAPPTPFTGTPGDGGDPLSDAREVAYATGDSLNILNHGPVNAIVTTVAAGAGCYFGRSLGTTLVQNATATAGAYGRIGAFAAQHSGLTPALGCLGGGAIAGTAVYSGAIFYGLGIILYVVLIIALIIAMFKTFFELIKAYVTLMIQTVAAPLIIMSGAIPGQGGAFSGWAKTMLANVLIFPAVFAAFFFAAFIMGKPDNTFGIPLGASGNFAIQSTVPLLGGLTGNFIKLILVYGILLIIPSIPGEVKKAFKVQDSPLGGAAIGGVLAGYGAGKTLAMRPFQRYIKQGQALKELEAKEAVSTDGKANKNPTIGTKIGRWFS